MSVSYDLDRLDRSDVSSARVEEALRTWQQTARLPRTQLSVPNNDWVLYVGPDARGELERAMRALPHRKAVALRTVVEQADEMFRSKTLNNPRADPCQPWWSRRWEP